MKTFVITLVMVVVVASGVYFLYETYQRDGAMVVGELPQEELTDSSVSYTGLVTKVDLQEVMFDGPARLTIAVGNETREITVPSMGRGLCLATSHIVAPELVEVGDTVSVLGTQSDDGTITPCVGSDHFLRVTGQVRDEAAGISFSYEKGTTGYDISSVRAEEDAPGDWLVSYKLMLLSDVTAATTRPPTEGPPALMVHVYANPGQLPLREWITTYATESYHALALSPVTETKLADVAAFYYTADGLYAKSVYVAAAYGKVYVFAGEYIDTNSPHLRDFRTLLDSVEFLDPAASLMSITLRLGVSGIVPQGLTITPEELIEDSRCPIDVTCIQAGTVRVRTVIEQASGKEERTFVLGVPQSVQDNTVTLAVVSPDSQQAKAIKDSDYRFVYQIQ